MRRTLIALALLAPGLALGDARLSPQHVAVGQSATLRVQADGGAPQIAAPDGVEVEPVGRSTEMQSVNGVVHTETSLLYRVTPTRAGHYDLRIGDEHVALDAGGAAPAPSRATSRTSASAHEDAAGLALLRVSLPKKQLWVGEAVPVTFKAYFRAGTEVTLNGAPSLGASSFTVSQLSEQPKQSVETIGGTPYRVATWTGIASAATSGPASIAPSLPVTLRYREVSAQPPRDPFAGMLDDDDDPFGASLMQRFFARGGFAGLDPFGPVRQRDVTLHAPTQGVDVRALPSEGRPRSFAGAVGQFDVHVDIPATGTAGEPLTLATTVTGRGNFDRVGAPALPADRAWKAYPAAVKSETAGEKRFEQAVVPLESGALQLPTVELSYFDPTHGRYVTKHAARRAVQVGPSADGTLAATMSGTPSPSVKPSMPGVRPDDGHWVARWRALHREAWPWLLQAVLLLTLGAALAARAVLRRQRPRREQLARARAEREALRRATEAGDAPRSFDAGRRALQLALAARWQLEPDQITEAEVSARLGDTGEPVQSALRAAERGRYGGRAPDRAALAAWAHAVERELDRLEVAP